MLFTKQEYFKFYTRWNPIFSEILPVIKKHEMNYMQMSNEFIRMSNGEEFLNDNEESLNDNGESFS